MAEKVFTADEIIDPESGPRNLFIIAREVHRAIHLCGGLTSDKGRARCKHSPNCGLPKLLDAIREKVGPDRQALVDLATTELIAATIGTENAFPPVAFPPPAAPSVVAAVAAPTPVPQSKPETPGAE